jgi:ATP synthase protein I
MVSQNNDKGRAMNENTDPPLPDDLKKRIKKAKSKQRTEEKEGQSGAASAFQVSTELIAGVGVGAFSGYYLDKYFDTQPVFFLICFFLGAIAGGYNIYRSVQSDIQKDNSEKDQDNQ